VSFSFCLPVEEACQCSPKKLSRYPLYRSLCILAGILLGVILAATGTSFTKAGTDDLTAMGLALVIVGISFFVLGILWLIFLFPLHSRYMKRQLLDRPGALFDLRDPPKLQRLYLENSHTYHIRKSSPDDLCLAALDPQRQCLWMEGCHYRYGIYGKDVVKLEPLESGQKVSLEIVYRIGGTELALVLYRESGTGMVLNPWIAKQFGKRFAGKFSRALGLEDQSF
jgi:hypothetical protein